MRKGAVKIFSLIMVQLIIANLMLMSVGAINKKPGTGNFDIFDGGSDIPQGKSVVVTYECCENCGYKKEFTYSQGKTITVQRSGYCKGDAMAFVGWISEDGEEYYGGETLPFASIKLKAKKVPLLLESNEVLSFSNSDRYFHTDEFDGYYMSNADYKMMRRNINRVFSPLSLVSAGLKIALSTYSDWEWVGSCYGMSTLVFLQHYGIIDVLEGRENAECIADLPNTAEVASKINYYQWSAAGSFLCENFSLKKGSEMYSQQLKDMYASVAEGNIVLFTYYPENIFTSSGHTVLLTGAYTQKDGTRVLVCYDCNNPQDYLSEAYEQRFYISEDFTSIKRGYSFPAYSSYEMGSFNWTDDYNHFKAFDISGNSSILPWYSHFIRQIAKTVKTSVSLIFT